MGLFYPQDHLFLQKSRSWWRNWGKNSEESSYKQMRSLLLQPFHKALITIFLSCEASVSHAMQLTG